LNASAEGFETDSKSVTIVGQCVAMLDRIDSQSTSQSSAIHSETISLYSAPLKTKGTTTLNTVPFIYATIEFLAVALTAYFIGLIYNGLLLNSPEVALIQLAS
jgi:hypothetical protein